MALLALPPYLVGEVLSRLDASDLARCELVCRELKLPCSQMMHLALPEFAAMVRLQMIYPTTNLTLFRNESWKILLLMHELFQHEVASVAASRQQQSLHAPLHLERISFHWVFETNIDEEDEEEQESGNGGTRRMGCNYVVRGFRKLVARVRSPTVCLPRQVAMAGWMGRCGHWGPASELLLQIVRSLQHAQLHDTPLVSREESRLELATMQSMVAECLVDKAYSSTYVNNDGSENRDLFIAYNMAHDALATLRDLTYKGGPEATHYLLRALATLGRTNALVGQHIGLNAMSSYYATKLPRCEQVFKEGEVVLLEGMALAREAGDRPAAALTLSCLAELLYCAASANTHGARALVQPHQQGLVSSVAELTRRSIAGSLEAIRILREDGEGRHARNLARIMKDLGKVYNFADRFSFREADDAACAQRWLTEALHLQRLVDGAHHRNVSNVRRLLTQAAHGLVAAAGGEPEPAGEGAGVSSSRNSTDTEWEEEYERERIVNSAERRPPAVHMHNHMLARRTAGIMQLLQKMPSSLLRLRPTVNAVLSLMHRWRVRAIGWIRRLS